MNKLAATATVAALSFMSSATGAADWSGFYVAGHVDAGWMKSDWNGFDGAEGAEGSIAALFVNTTNFSGENKDTGWGAGVGLGYNFQFDKLVLGAIADWTWLNADDTQVVAGCCGPDTLHTRIHSVGTLRGLVGLDMDSVMPYVTGGWAWGDVSRRFHSANGITFNMDANDGWTAGGGLKIALAPNTALNAEVLYVDFGSASKSVSLPLVEAGARVKTHMTIARLGLEFRF